MEDPTVAVPAEEVEEEGAVAEDVSMKAPKGVEEVSCASGNSYTGPTAEVDPADVNDLLDLGWTKTPVAKTHHKAR